MTIIINKVATHVLAGERRARASSAVEPLSVPSPLPFQRPSRLRELVGGPLTIPEVFPFMALIFMAGYLLWCILGEPRFLWAGSFSLAE